MMATTAEARDSLDRLQSLLQSDSPEAAVNATVAYTLKNDVITKLRSQYSELARLEAGWSARYGPDHLVVVNTIRNQMRELQSEIRDQLKPIAETHMSVVQNCPIPGTLSRRDFVFDPKRRPAR